MILLIAIKTIGKDEEPNSSCSLESLIIGLFDSVVRQFFMGRITNLSNNGVLECG